MSRESKKSYCRLLHCKKRIKERYHIDVELWEIERITLWVREGRCTKVRKRLNKRVQYSIFYRGVLMHFIYCRPSGEIVTFIPSHGY